jgi:hypothetical protein
MTVRASSEPVGVRWEVASLSIVVRHAVDRFDEMTTGRAVLDTEAGANVVRAVTERITTAASRVGLERPAGWRLLSLRDRLESHSLAATVLARSEASPGVSLRVLRRGLAEAASELTDVLEAS